MSLPQIPATLAERMWRHIDRKPDGCWQWTAAVRSNGYGLVAINRTTMASSHRVMYELLVGPISDGLHLDHLCRNPPCCNPAHLEPVTPLVNARRGRGHGSETHCPQGHPYVWPNLYEHKGRRYCRACRRDRYAASRAA